ncbi:hypothetical protein ABZ917_42710 [Nonomuraea wenchangensis]
MRPELWDRVSGAPVPLPDSAALLGRYLIPAGRHVVSGVAVEPGAYLAAGAGRWTLRSGGEHWSGDFGAAPTPAPIVMESIAFIAGKVADLQRDDAPLSAWTSVPPLVNGVVDRLRAHPLERHLKAGLGHLRAVCQRPHARLRTEDVLVPVSKARRITWRTVVHLAAHSETWAARRLHGVEPARLLTPVQIADHDLYENRVVATLLDRLWGHVLARIAEIEQIDSMVGQGKDLIQQAEIRPDWREKRRLYAFIADLLMGDDLPARIDRRRRELLALRNALAPLLTSELRSGVRGPYMGPPWLRPTNLFDNDVNYRHCRRLWDVETTSRQGANGLAEPVHALTAWCRDFARYALVLVLRALEQLGLTPAGTGAPNAGEPGPAYAYRGRTVRIDWNHDDTFTLLLDDEQVLRVVPLAHALTGQSDLAELDGHLKGLTAECRVAVLYPGERSEREALPLDRRLAVHNSTMVPVSPTDLGSMARVARALRAALDEKIMLAYPARVTCRIAGAGALAGRFPWLTWRDGQLIVTCPPADHELARLTSALTDLRTRTDAARQQGDNAGELNRLRSDLLAAADQIISLSLCPFCGRRATTFVPRDPDTYWCRCSCSTTWEIRRCPSCRRNYPVMTVPTLADRTGGDGDLLDEEFSQEVLAVPCWQNARSYVCPFCDHCPKSAACDRCSLSPGS